MSIPTFYEKKKKNTGLLYLGDSLEILPTLKEKSVDLICADPPYQSVLSSSAQYNTIGDLMNIKRFFYPIFKSFNQMLKPTGSAYVFCDWRTYPLIYEVACLSNLKPTNLVVWDYGWIKAGAYYRFRHEFIFFLTKAKTPRFSRKDLPDVWRMKPLNFTVPRLLKTEKPIWVIDKIIKTSSKPNDLVIDPFLGTGTSAVSCIRQNRNWVGIELDPRIFALAERLIDEEERGNIGRKILLETLTAVV